MVWLHNEKSLITFDPLWNEDAVKIKNMIIWSYLHLINAAQVSFVALGSQFLIKKTHLNFRLSLRVDDVGIVRICLLCDLDLQNNQPYLVKEQIFCIERDSRGNSSLQRKMINENLPFLAHIFIFFSRTTGPILSKVRTILGWRGFKFVQMNNHSILKK